CSSALWSATSVAETTRRAASGLGRSDRQILASGDEQYSGTPEGRTRCNGRGVRESHEVSASRNHRQRNRWWTDRCCSYYKRRRIRLGQTKTLFQRRTQPTIFGSVLEEVVG